MDSSKPSPLQCFTCFPNLPTELRLNIWRNCQPGARLVIVGKYARYSRHDSKEPPAPPAPTTLFVNRESRSETLKAYCLIQPQFYSLIAFNPHRDTILPWHKIWPKDRCGFFTLRPYAGPELEIRSIALSFASIEMEFEELLDRILTYPLLDELVLLQERNWEDSVPTTTIDVNTRFDAWFRLQTEANRLRSFIRYLNDRTSRFSTGRLPLLKFMRVTVLEGEILGSGGD